MKFRIVADFVGDSLDLSQKAAEVDAETIVFCGGVHLWPRVRRCWRRKDGTSAGSACGLPAGQHGYRPTVTGSPETVPPRGSHPVAYINSTAEVKAESDICCTSANAVEVVNSLQEERVLFVPDKNLGGLCFPVYR